MTDPKQRFSDRAANYARYRPGYPKAVLGLLEAECGLASEWTVADVASGTGQLAGLFLKNGNRVFGVEPNEEMRRAGESHLGNHPSFTSVAGTAEATTLDDGSVDLVVAGHAFHWFDPGPTRAEFARISRSPGWVALLWNELREDATTFLTAYECLIRTYKTEEYKPFEMEEEVRSFFGQFSASVLGHRQTFDLDGLRGRLLSSSYVPDEGQPGHGAMMHDLEEVFNAYQESGRVSIEYDTLVFYGRL